MKKITLLFTLLFIAFQADAQLWISADVGFTTSGNKAEFTSGGTTIESDGPRTLDLIFAPTIGYNINDNITIGGIIAYNLDRTVAEGDNTKETDAISEIAILPFMRYNHAINEKFGLYGQLDLGPSFGKVTSEFESGSTTVTSEANLLGFGINIRPGVYFQFSDHFSMNAHYGALGFNSDRFKVEDDNAEQISRNSDFGLNLQMSSLRFGLNYHF